MIIEIIAIIMMMVIHFIHYVSNQVVGLTHICYVLEMD